LDFSIFKNNPVRAISETFNIQFRAEFFNVLNFTNFAPPSANKNLFSFASNSAGTITSFSSIATAGVLTSTQTTSRQLQFALKVSW
jgi:hypothetical protein